MHTNYTTRITNLLRETNESSSVHYEACLRSPHYKNTLVTLFISVIVLSGIQNILLWIVFVTKKKLRSIAIAYLISLSASDFLTAATVAWMEVVYVMDYPIWNFGELGSNLVNAFWCFSLVTPFTHIVFITIDRYRAVTSATLYSEGKSWRTEIFKIMLIWVYSVGIVLLLTFNFGPAPGYMYQWNVLPEWYYPFLAIHTALPLAICTVLYVKMARFIKLRKRIVRRYVANPGFREFKVARSIAIIIFFLYIVWIPVIALETIYATHSHTCLIAQLGTISVWLTCTSGVINPIIFLTKSVNFREVICCVLETEPVRRIGAFVENVHWTTVAPLSVAHNVQSTSC